MNNRSRVSLIGLFSICFVLLEIISLHSTSLLKLNLADLIKQSDYILIGKVITVTDGFTNALGGKLPYTDVTIEVSEAIKGNVSYTYTFRQFGLVKPRNLDNGKTYVGVSPDGWPRFKEGEEVMLFLPKPSSIGFSTSIGLFQGKFDIVNEQIFNALDNRGLFDNVSIDTNVLSEEEQKLLQMSILPVNYTLPDTQRGIIF